MGSERHIPSLRLVRYIYGRVPTSKIRNIAERYRVRLFRPEHLNAGLHRLRQAALSTSGLKALDLGGTNFLRPRVNNVERFVSDVISYHVQAFGFSTQLVEPGTVDKWSKWD